MNVFEYIKPLNLEQALTARREYPDAAILAGGTDLFVKMKAGILAPERIIDIGELERLRVLEIAEDEIYIGAAVKVSEIEKDARLKERIPSLTGAAFSLGAPQVRNLATVGGNICNASPSADLLPSLYAYGAQMVVCNAAGEKRVPIDEFVTGPGKTALQKDEILIGISIPHKAGVGRAIYLKHALKRSMDIAAVNICVYLEGISPVRDCRIVLGAVGPTPLRATQAEQFLTGRTLDLESIASAAKMAREACRAIDDIRTTAAYRKEVMGVLCKRGLYAIMQKENGACCHASH